MKICVAQTKPTAGNIDANIINHIRVIELAVSKSVDLIVFPELSLTGYEPTLAKTLAMDKEDIRLKVFQRICNKNRITICIGIPFKASKGTAISLVIFQPNQTTQIYSKGHLHSDEEPYFHVGDNSFLLNFNNLKIALAICYEISIPEHSRDAYKSGAEIYIASVAKSPNGVTKAREELANIANQYSMNVLMSNCIGPSDGSLCGGRTSIWSKNGELIGDLDDSNEGVLVLDTKTRKAEKYIL